MNIAENSRPLESDEDTFTTTVNRFDLQRKPSDVETTDTDEYLQYMDVLRDEVLKLSNVEKGIFRFSGLAAKSTFPIPDGFRN